MVVRGGTYRDGVATSTAKRFTLQPFPHEQVWFDGTDVVTGWTPTSPGVWSRTGWSTPTFCGGHYDVRPWQAQDAEGSGPCTHRDMALDPANPAAADPQMLFVDGVPVPETGDAAHLVGRFACDQAARTVRLGIDPSGHRVEMATRASALVLQGGRGTTVRGIGFLRYATNEFPGNRIRSTSAARGSGAPLAADVAAAIGVLAGRPVDPGALVQPARRVTGAGRTRERLTTGS